MNITDHYFTNYDATKIFYRIANCKQKKNTIILLIHGWSEHSGKYYEVLKKLTSAQYMVYAPDMRGHGLSDGPRGFVRMFNQYTSDMTRMIDIIYEENQGADVNIKVIGHSMGGLIAIRLAEALMGQGQIHGLVTSGAYLKLAYPVAAYKVAVATFMSQYFPIFSLPQEIKPEDLSSDPQKNEEHANDPLNHGMANSRWYTEMAKAQKLAFDQAGKIDMPTLLMHGGSDTVASPDGSKQLFSKLKGNDNKLEIFDNMQHELFQERDREKVFSSMLQWLKAHD